MHKSNFDGLMVTLASPEDVAQWSHGAVDSPDTINYRTGKPKQKWLFCECIFGPVKNYECSCGKYKWVRYKGIVCERCGVEVASSRVRRERMGHIELASPVVHIRYVKATPSRVGLLLDLSVNEIERILAFVKYIVIKPVSDEAMKQVIQHLEADLKEKMKELDGIYKEELAHIKEGKKGDEKDKKLSKEDLDRLYEDNKNQLEKEFNRLKSIVSSLKLGSTILESDFRNVFEQFSDKLHFQSGAIALQSLLSAINIEEQIKNIAGKFSTLKGEEKKKSIKLLKLLINLHVSNVKPEWMIIKNLPVIPPDLRPVVQLDGGKFASSDVNTFYRRVLMRNIRLKKMVQVGMPDVVKKNEIRLLQESVNNLLIGEKAWATKAGSGLKVFKSLTDMLSGKEGIFRKNLLGKRVDYSGRSVITVGPTLSLSECGLPLYIAVRIFSPFIIGKLIEKKIVYTPKQAEKLIKDEAPIALRILEEVIKDKYVLLNRAPTLHRLSIEAFKIRLMPGKTIRLHPLVCSSFNADFDGDQMAVHLPISEEAQREAKELIAADRNILKPSSWEPTISHSQDTVLGIYHLTDSYGLDKNKLPHEQNYKGVFNTYEEVLNEYHSSTLTIRDVILLKVNKEHIATTVWRVYFNSLIPERLRFINEKVGKKQIRNILDRIFDEYWSEETVRIADLLKNIGFKYATHSSTTISIFDMAVPQEKQEILRKGDDQAKDIYDLNHIGFLSEEEKHRLIVKNRSDIKGEIEQLAKKAYNPGNSIFSMIDSGARGTQAQITQISGMKGLVVSPSGETIELPIKSSLIEGLSPIEYFISSHSARKGKADTALRTAESGYLTRRLCDASQDVIVREYDCKTEEFITISADEAKVRNENFDNLIYGRVLAQDVKDSQGNKALMKGEIVNKENLKLINDLKIDYIKVRSPLTCHVIGGVCQKCYGLDLSTRSLVEIGTPVGIIASQSIGEPGTQLTMRTFHGEKAATEADITQGIRRIEELFEIRKPKKAAVIAPFDGNVKLTESGKLIEVEITSDPIQRTYIIKDGYKATVKKGQALEKWWSYASKGKSKLKVKEDGEVMEIHKDYIVIGVIHKHVKAVGSYAVLKVNNGDKVYKWQILSLGSIDIKDYKVIVGDLETQKYIVRETKKVFTSQGQDVNDKYMEIIVKQLFSKVFVEDPGDSHFVPGTIVKYEEFLSINREFERQGKVKAKGERLALGLTQIAKETDSWLSAASFQETIRVMVEASLRGSIDNLNDLKSNVIIGRLLPVWDVYKEKMNEMSWNSMENNYTL